MAAPSITTTFVANTTAKASEVNQNFTDIINGLSSGSTWDIHATSLTCPSITAATEVVVNDAGGDVDFRVEGDTDAHLLFCDAGNDAVCIGTNTLSTGARLTVDGSLHTGAPATTKQEHLLFNTQSTFSGQMHSINLENLGLYAGYKYDGANYVTNTGTSAAGIRFVAGEVRFYTDASLSASSSFTPSQRMAIDSSGNVGIGIDPSYKFHVSSIVNDTITARISNSTAAASSSADILLDLQWSGDTDPSNAYFVRFGRLADNEIGHIRAATSSSVAYDTTSDARYKMNQRKLEYGISTIKAINAKRFEWVDCGTSDIGLIAQEVHEVAPEVVHKPDNEDGRWAMDYSKLTPILWSAIQELTARLEALESK